MWGSPRADWAAARSRKQLAMASFTPLDSVGTTMGIFLAGSLYAASCFSDTDIDGPPGVALALVVWCFCSPCDQPSSEGLPKEVAAGFESNADVLCKLPAQVSSTQIKANN